MLPDLWKKMPVRNAGTPEFIMATQSGEQKG
jgi:hypothetical protein